MHVVGQTVSAVRPLLAARGVSPVYHVLRRNRAGRIIETSVAHVPGSYVVHSAYTFEPGKVILEVGPIRTAPGS